MTNSLSCGLRPLFSWRRLSSTALVFFLSLCPLWARPADAQPAEALSSLRSAPVHADTIGEVISRWKPDVHLYVLGDVGLDEETLSELAGWLAGKHWTVLLVEDASGQTFTDADGVPRLGDAAIEYGTGQGIARRSGFSALVHPETGEPDGAILSIVLAQRSLFYTGSEAQDSRALGESQFQGSLDQWAIEALRSGRDIVRAVKDTVTNIDSQLAAAIDQEIQQADLALASAVEQIEALENRLSELREVAPGAVARLETADPVVLRAQVAEVRELQSRRGAGKAQEILILNSVLERSTSSLQLLAGLEGQIEGVRSDARKAAETLTALEKSAAQLRRLDPEASGLPGGLDIRGLRQDLARAEASITEDPVAAFTGVAEVQSRAEAGIRAIAERKDEIALRRTALVLLLLAAGGAIVATGVLLNRRRRGVKGEAEKLLAAWRAALDRKLAIFFDELERRMALFVGPASGDGKRHHAGETLSLAEQIRADVGSLSILWTSANSVLEKAEALIRAPGLGKVYNFFLPGKYRRGIALLQDEPVPFDPADGLPRLFGQERTWRDDLLGDLASYEPFRKSFQEIVAELDLRAGRAAGSLDVIERSVVQGPADLAGTEERIRQAGSLREEIELAGAGDGLFRLPALFAVALPAATAALERARELFPTDPVGALRGDGALARRIAMESLELATFAAAARHGVLAAIEAGMAVLREASIATGWIEAERIRLSGQADLLAARAAEAPVALEIEELVQQMAWHGRRVDRAAALCGVLQATSRPEIRRVSEVVRIARGELGAALELPADRLLHEEDADPSERLEGSTRQAETAHAALGQGELDAAETALAETARLTAEADAIVEASRQALAAHASTVAGRRAETGRIEALLPNHERILLGIRETFAPGVLLLRAGDPFHPSANGTLGDNLEEARAHLRLAHEKLDRAVAIHPGGRLLAAADLLEQVKSHQELAVHRLEEIAERQARLERTVESNRSFLETLEGRVLEDQTGVAGDPRVMQPTLAAFAEGARQVQQARRTVEAAPGDPFVAEEELLAAKTLLDEVHIVRAPGDRLVFTETQRSVEAAKRQLTAAQDLAGRAAGDGIADSPEIIRALREVEALWTLHGRVSEALQAPHGDWNALDQEADRIASEAALQAASLSGQIAAARQAAAAVSAASQKVREATSWSGGYGVTIPGNPGGDALSQARALLAAGDYEGAGRQAQWAHRAAADAIEAAEETVRRIREEQRRREEERRRDEERRRRAAVASSLISSSSRSSSSSGSSSSGGGSSSGSGRSSFGGGSSSGSGRSSW
jgi:uncharacterized membrane protein YgcG